MTARTTERVLIVEDEPEFAELMALWLRRGGREATVVSSGAAALRAVYDQRPDLVTLDIGIPAPDGWTICERIREASDVPVLIVSARGAEADRIRGLELGADDYITKPFSFREFVARVDAALRRRAPERPEGRALHHRGLMIDRQAHRATLDGTELQLTPTEFRVLACLVERPGELIGHEELLQRGWGPDYRSEVHLLRMVVRGLRSKLERIAPGSGYLVTQYGLGYRLAPRLSPDPSAS